MAGSTAASNLEGFAYTTMNAFHQASVSFTGQNYGAGNYKRIKKILLICSGAVTVVGLVAGVGIYLLGDILLQLYSTDPEVIAFGVQRLAYIAVPYFLCGLQEVVVGVIRGMGYAIMPMMVSLVGICVFRVVWIYTIFQAHKTLGMLYISYPVTWILTIVAHFVCFAVVYRKKTRDRVIG